MPNVAYLVAFLAKENGPSSWKYDSVEQGTLLESVCSWAGNIIDYPVHLFLGLQQLPKPCTDTSDETMHQK